MLQGKLSIVGVVEPGNAEFVFHNTQHNIASHGKWLFVQTNPVLICIRCLVLQNGLV